MQTDVLETLRTSAPAAVRCAAHVRLAHQDSAEKGSVVEQDFARQSHFAAAWGAEPVAQVYSLASMLLLVAEDELVALSRSLDPAALDGRGANVFGAASTSRASLEASGAAWWLLDPALGSLDRICRAMLHRLEGLDQQAYLFALVDEVQDETDRASMPSNFGDRSKLERQAEAIRRGASELGLTVRRDRRVRRGNSWKAHIGIGDQSRRSYTELVADLLGDMRQGGTWYAYLAAVSHANAYGMWDQLVLSDIDGYAQLVADPRMVTMTIGFALTGYQKARTRFFELHGWKDDAWLSLWQYTNGALLEAIKESEGPSQ